MWIKNADKELSTRKQAIYQHNSQLKTKKVQKKMTNNQQIHVIHKSNGSKKLNCEYKSF